MYGFQDNSNRDPLAQALGDIDDPKTALLFEQYCRDGFLIHDFGFNPDLIEACAEVTREFHTKCARVQDYWRRNSSVKQLATHPDVLELLSTFYRRRPFPFQTLNFPVGTQQKTHADTHHFNSFPERFMCGVWVALEDIDMENGPLHYFPGSHGLSIPTRAEMVLSGVSNADEYFARASEGFEKHYGIVRKGEAVIWSANLLHGGSLVKDKDRTRLSQVSHYYFDDCVYFSPIKSDPEAGHIDVRRPIDIGTGKFVPSLLNGDEVKPHWKTKMYTDFHKFIKYAPQF